MMDWDSINFENYYDVPKEILQNIQPCPFCGSTDSFNLTPRKKFEESLNECGIASMMLSCRACEATMFDTSICESDYNKRLQIILSKWNSRGRLTKGVCSDGDSDFSD